MEMIPLEKFKIAKKNMEDLHVLNSSKLIPMPFMSAREGNTIYLKPEVLQKIGAYKIRGAFNFIFNMTEEEKKIGVITASAGNHAQGVALSAKMLGVKAIIVMPKPTPLIKVDNVRKYGAEVVLEGNIYDEACQHALRLQKEHGYVFAHPFNVDPVIIGQGTIALEILEDLPDTDIILVPVGGGGLVAGIAMAAKQINPNVKVIAVEPASAPCMNEALKAGKIVTIPKVSTIADGTAVATFGDRTFEYCKQYVDDIILVADEELTESFITLMNEAKLVAEPSGLLALAAVKKLKCKGKKVVPIISGGNIDLFMVQSFLQKGMILTHRVLTFKVIVLNKIEAVPELTELLRSMGANILEIHHKTYNNFDLFHEIEIEVTVGTKNKDHQEEILKTLEEKNYKLIK